MTNPLAILRQVVRYGTEERLHDKVYFWCPGCDHLHGINVPTEGVANEGAPVWEWNGALDETITVSPSILCYGSVFLHEDGTQCPNWHEDYKTTTHTQGNCHSFLKNGKWEFLADSAHKLAGSTVPMVPLPDWVVKE